MIFKTKEEIDKLLNQKSELVKEYRENMIKFSEKIFERADRSVRERQIDTEGEAGILDKFKAAFSIIRGDALKIPEDKILPWGEKLLMEQKDTFERIMNDSKASHNSVIQDLDHAIADRNVELEKLRKRIDEIDKQLRTETDPNVIDSRIREKTGLESRSIPDNLE